jgi:tetratricopeptide (TPR) repeat protein
MAALLVLVTIALYWPVMRHDFISYDDPIYVTDNPHVRAGLSWEGLVWAFGRVHGSQTYWHPLTWVSHMVDCQLYGLKPGGHHLTSVLLHAANTVLVFLVFRRMTGAYWRCVTLAALFALHPLQVDSVAWVAERKTLLSAFFWLLSLWAYVRYAEVQSPKSKVQTPKSEFQSPKSKVQSLGFRVQSPASHITDHGSRITHYPSLFYVLSLFFTACGLMCKPVLVTLPFVLLLLDYWPLQRFQLSTLNAQRSTSPPLRGLELKTQGSRLKVFLPLLWEKLPFFALAAASSVITVLAHQALGMLNPVSMPPWDARLENALVSYVRYLGKTFWPSRLAIFYPYPTAWPMWEVVTCALLLLAISGLVLGTARSRPWLFVGWFWFLGVLVPFVGLIQAGAQAMADRFMYVPALGILVALIWGLHGLAKGGRYQQSGLSVAGAAAIVLCLVLTRQQLGYWNNSQTLFQHALEVTESNYLAHNNLGSALDAKSQIDQAMTEFQEAIRLKPDYALAHNNLGIALDAKGRLDEAIREFREVIRLKPNYAEAHKNLGMALYRQSQIEEAIRELQKAVRLKPDDAEAHNSFGNALFRQGQIEEAIRQFREAIRLQPDFAEAHNNFGNALVRQGQTDDGIREFQEAIRLKPDYALAHSNLGIALVRKGQIDEGIREFQEAVRLKPDFAEARHNLARALAMKNAPGGQ